MPRGGHQRATTGLVLAALGVVFGDIGTSPLYSVQTVFAIDHHAVRPTSGDVHGVISFVFWAITVVVSIKYVTVVMRADNEGEGGVLALAALVRRSLANPRARHRVVMMLGVLGACLFYGDSVITPAISVLSAVEGVRVASPDVGEITVPLAAIILSALFVAQRFGTRRVGGLFGPVMFVWFSSIAAAGLAEIVRHPGVLVSLSPSYAVEFVMAHVYTAFIAMGAIVLAITGAEALYADMGHFGRGSIARAWFFVAFPALTLNYLGQGALILHHTGAIANPFFLLLPGWARLPMVALATVATVIASQAVISGAFSVSRQATQLGYLPPLTVRQTSESAIGQVYLPAVNTLLFIGVLAITLGFRTSSRLATAYGVAVTATFLITTALLLTAARMVWHWPVWKVAVVGAAFGSLELVFFTANLTKVLSGGWLPLMIAFGLFTVMTTWQRGRTLVTERRTAEEGPLRSFIDALHHDGVRRIPGTAVFPHPTGDTTPLALRANVAHNHVVHDNVVIISAVPAHVPHVAVRDQVRRDNLGYDDDGIIHLTARYGFADEPNLPAALAIARAMKLLDPGVDTENGSYFVSRIVLRRTRARGMQRWRKILFTGLARNAASPLEHFCLPLDRTVVMGTHIDL